MCERASSHCGGRSNSSQLGPKQEFWEISHYAHFSRNKPHTTAWNTNTKSNQSMACTQSTRSPSRLVRKLFTGSRLADSRGECASPPHSVAACLLTNRKLCQKIVCPCAKCQRLHLIINKPCPPKCIAQSSTTSTGASRRRSPSASKVRSELNKFLCCGSLAAE